MTKYIFISGNILEFRKSIFVGSIGALIKEDSFKINIKKITENKLERTFVTSDGYELDTDMGFYERIAEINTTLNNNLILNKNHKESDLVKFIKFDAKKYDIVLIESNNIYFYIIKYFINKYSKKNVIHIHFTSDSYLITNDNKPDLIINKNDFINFMNLNIYKIPYLLFDLKIKNKIYNLLDLKYNNYTKWVKIYYDLNNLNGIIYVYVIIKFNDSYISLMESLKHACYSLNKNIKIIWIDPENITKTELFYKLNEYKGGIIVPGGFGNIGFENKINAITFARENNIPFLGICYGMQIMVIEYARNKLNINNATTEEIDIQNKYIHVINSIELINKNKKRLGNYVGKIDKKSIAYNIFNREIYIERYRHNYKINNNYVNDFEKNGLFFSGRSLDSQIMEIAEVPINKFFIGVQFHPELNSKIYNPNPIILSFIKSFN